MLGPQHTSRGSDLETEGLCLLSLDGGGVRGLSTLMILETLMARINSKREEAAKPCEVFDLIGGTSTGGIIAIMLGRLEMDVSECIEIYKNLLKDVFGYRKKMWKVSLKGKFQAQFDETLLRKAIEKTVKSKIAVDIMFEDGQQRSARTFVVATRGENKNPVRIRDYRLNDEINRDPATIVEAALATSAATTFFPSFKIGAREYHDGALGNNNPVNIVWREAQNIWCSDDDNQEALSSKVKCLISIGTGNPGTSPIKDDALGFLKDTLKAIATETEITATAAAENFKAWLNPRKTQRYFRFNVEQGLQNVGLEEYLKQGEIESATNDYLDHQVQKFSVSQCAENMSTKTTRTPLKFKSRTPPNAAKYEAQRREVLRWLAFLDQSRLHDEFRRKRAPGTGQEFLDGYYRQWLDSGSPLLWLYGDVGRGKTKLCSLLIDRTQMMLSERAVSREPNDGIAYFYFSFDDKNTHLPTCFLHTILAQLCPAYQALPEVVEMFERNNPWAASQEELFRVLGSIMQNHVFQTPETERKAVETFTSLTLFLDGLDEIPVGAQTEVLRLLNALASLESVNTRIVVTSRPEFICQQYLNAVNNWHCHEIPSEQVERDICLFAEHEINCHRGLKLQSEEVKKNICRRLSKGAQGMFRLAFLQMQELTAFYGSSIPQSEIDEILDDLPIDLDGYYDRILNRIPSRRQQKLHTVLKWILFSTQPMFVEEAVDASIIHSNKEVSFDKNDRFDPKEIVANLMGLVKLQPSWSASAEPIPYKTHILTLSHFSVHEYLLPLKNPARPSTKTLSTTWRFECKLAHRAIVTCCFAYLHHCSLQEDGRTTAYPLRSYAWWNWATHLVAAQSSGQTTDAQMKLDSLRLFNTITFPALYEGTAEAPGKKMVAKWSAHREAAQLLRSWWNWVTHLVAAQPTGRINDAKTKLPSVPLFNTIAFPALYDDITESSGERSGAEWSAFREAVQCLPGDKYENFLDALKNTHLPYDRLPQEVEFNRPISREDIMRANLVTQRTHEDVTETENTFQFNGPTAYKFRPLYDDPRTIRLLILLPSEDRYSRIECSLATDALDNHPKYTALSYSWGDPTERESIFIDGQWFNVTMNLHVALRHLRLKTEVRVLWIDAICISMSDLYERSSQIMQMTDIYRAAADVVVWLGLATEESDRGLSHLYVTDESPPEPSIFAPLNDIIGRPVWRRSWLIQEVVVANKVSVLCGHLSIEWDSIRDVNRLRNDMIAHQMNSDYLSRTELQEEPLDDRVSPDDFVQRFAQGRLGERHDAEVAMVPQASPSIVDLIGHWTYFTVIQYLRGHFRNKGEITLPELLYLSKHHLATDPRDKVFAILSLLPNTDRTESLLQADYSTTYGDIFTRVAVYILKKYQNLDLFSCICQHDEERSRVDFEVPSWAPLWDGNLQVSLAPGIFMPTQPENFNAGGPSCPEPITFSDDLREVTCQGVIVDSLGFEDGSGICDKYRMGKYEYVWKQAFGDNSQAGNVVTQRFPGRSKRREACWRTILADEKLLDDGTRARLGPLSISSESSDMFLTELRRQQHRSTHSEHYFVTKRGFIGKVVGSKLVHGDIIAVLLGGKVPFILRSTDWGTYRLIGECYVHGIMDWEQGMKRTLEEQPELLHMIRLV